MVVLDTATLIDAHHDQGGAMDAIRQAQASGALIRITAATWMEYLAVIPIHRRTDAIGRLLGAVEFEPMTRELAESCAAIQHDLLTRGERLAWHDLHLAATALHYHEPLVTRDRAFARVPGLLLQTY
ncbi:MAG: type II toxin-antitoxin system VapC family toxin [Thermoplasmatota archaeon]